MAATHRAPKQWSLGKIETVNSLENWWQNLIYTLSQDRAFSPYLSPGASWLTRGRANSNRGFTDDGNNVPAAERLTATQKVATLEMMLGQIANYCPVISRNTIVRSSKSITSIYQTIRLHYGFQSTGAQFLDFADFKLEADERPEDLYQRIVAFVEDNLLLKDSGIKHHEACIEEDEEMSPTLENIIVLTWLRLIHPALPKLVKQRYGTELRSRTLASIKPEISQALDSLIDELHSTEENRIMRSNMSGRSKPAPPTQKSKRFPSFHNPRSSKSCPLCKEGGRPNSHYLSECKYLPESDRKFMSKTRQICNIFDDDDANDDGEAEYTDFTTSRVEIRASPFLDTFFEHHHVRVILDSGATGDMIRASTAKALGIKITKATQTARQADGRSPLCVVGEARMQLTHGDRQLQFAGLVVENLDVDILAGMPFMHRNQIGILPARNQVVFGDGTAIRYSDEDKPYTSTKHAMVLRAPTESITVWPGEFIEVKIPAQYPSNAMYAVEARQDTAKPPRRNSKHPWPSPSILPSIAGRIRIPNLTSQPQTLSRNEHFCQLLPTYVPDADSNEPIRTPVKCSLSKTHGKFSDSIQLDPEKLLDHNTRQKFAKLHSEYDAVFGSDIPGYNGAMGPCNAVVNMGPVLPPQRKGRVPQYSRDKLLELQDQFDELERIGVFRRPAEIGLCAEYLNPSFLVKKPNGGHRLVTAFADVGRYAKPQPSLMPDVDSTLRQIGQWKYIIVSDLSKAFYQIPLSQESIKYCGVATPFKGVRVYVRSAMGMPGSETALEELMCTVFGELLHEGVIAKLADDLFCGGQTTEELYHNWSRVLKLLHLCDLRLSASKTIVVPRSTTILGWCWEQGTIRASSHRIASLSTCKPPEKVKGMRSFIGAYKVLSRVLPGCASLLTALEKSTEALASPDLIPWTDELRQAFSTAQNALSSHKTIVLPRADDLLWIITDGSVKQQGIGATLYANRGGQLRLAGFFSAKLRDRQVTWLPCEVEALAIAAATKHFSPFIIQSKHNACILTDSKPCVQAYEKLCRGEFSASPRVTTFLSTVSRFQVSVRHIAGVSNLPADHASRNALPCTESSCQVCTFVAETEESVVRSINPKDIISGKAKLPFTSRATWLALQNECSDLRRTHAHLVQGTRPSKKLTNIKDIKRYLNCTSIAKDGLIVVIRNDPLSPTRECIVVPRHVLDGLLTALHITLDHPSAHQLKCAFKRYLYALDLDNAISRVTSGCHVCASLRKHQHTVIEQSTGDPPENVGSRFAADVMKRNTQLVLVVRECVTSFTLTCILSSERKDDIRDAIITLCVGICPLDGPNIVIRSDAGPAFQALTNDPALNLHRISLEIGRVKNPNKNPVAEKAIQELEQEIVRQDHRGGLINHKTLAVATARLNSRIRSRGLSAREMWLQRDMFTNSQIPLSDYDLIMNQHDERSRNHKYSEKAKAPGRSLPPDNRIDIGDIVYLYRDNNKHKARDRYLVTAVEGTWCNIRKFVGHQLRKSAYRVKKSELYKASSVEPPSEDQCSQMTDDDSPENTSPQTQDTQEVLPTINHPALQESLPEIPPEIHQPDYDADGMTPLEYDGLEEIPQMNGRETHRYPRRERRPPKWHDDFIV